MTIQIKTSIKEAQKFIKSMELLGFQAIKDLTSTKEQEYWYFNKNGVIDIKYQVCIFRFSNDKKAYIGIKP